MTTKVIRWSDGQMVRWSGVQVVRCTGGQVYRWSGGQVIVIKIVCLCIILAVVPV